MRKRIIKLFFLLCLPFYSFADSSPFIYILGTAQDGGYPHLGCAASCCEMAWQNDSLRRHVVSLALADPLSQQWWLFEATPDIREQLKLFQELTGGKYPYLPSGIFITHAHIGHYTGLMQLGKEVFSTKELPVYAMPRMKEYLSTNGPWSQLVQHGNIKLMDITEGTPVHISEGLSILPIRVPHRDEYSETVGFRILTVSKKYLFIPDIDKWEKWNRNIVEEIKLVDAAFIDGTFYRDGELLNRKMSEVPHPFVSETLLLFEHLPDEVKNKIYFIHLNHSNPLLSDENEKRRIEEMGFHVAEQGSKI